MARPRNFFRTKPKTPFQRLPDNVSNKTDSDDDFDTFQLLSSSRANSSSTPATTSRNYSSPTLTSTFRHYSSSPISTSSIVPFNQDTPYSIETRRTTQRPIPVIDITNDLMEVKNFENPNQSHDASL